MPEGATAEGIEPLSVWRRPFGRGDVVAREAPGARRCLALWRRLGDDGVLIGHFLVTRAVVEADRGNGVPIVEIIRAGVPAPGGLIRRERLDEGGLQHRREINPRTDLPQRLSRELSRRARRARVS